MGGRSEHVPGIEIEKGHEEVETDCGGGADDEVGEDVVSEDEFGEGVAELGDDDVEGGEGGVGHYEGVDEHGGEEHFFGALRSVPHAQDELRTNQEDTGESQRGENVQAKVMSKGVEFGI